MTHPASEIIATEDLLALASWARDVFDPPDTGEDDWLGDDEEEDARYREFPLAAAAMRFVAAAGAAGGERAVLPFVSRFLAHSERLDPADSMRDVMADSVERMARAATQVDDELLRLASHSNWAFRRAVAKGLRPFDDAALAVLSALAADADVEVRQRARSQLAGARDLPEGFGFLREELESTDGDTTADSPVLAAALELWNAPNGHWRTDPTAVERAIDVVGELPDDLAVGVLEALLARPDSDLHCIDVWLPALMNLEGSERAFARLMKLWGPIAPTGWRHTRAKLAVAAVSAARRGALAQQLVRELQAVVEEPGEPFDKRWQATHMAAIVAELWPPDLDPSPVLEAVLGIDLEAALVSEVEEPKSMFNHMGLQLERFFQRTDVDLSPLLPWLTRARAAGLPGRCAAIPHTLLAFVTSTSSAELRTIALQAITERREENLAWAMTYLTGAGHDADRDPQKAEMVAAWYADPQLRGYVLACEEVMGFVMLQARRDLVERRLDVAESLSVARVAVRNGSTEQEWAVIRDLRAVAPPEETVRYLHLLPRDWSVDDVMWLHSVAERPIGERETFQMLMTLARRPSPEADAIMVRMLDTLVAEQRWDALGGWRQPALRRRLPASLAQRADELVDRVKHPDAVGDDWIEEED